MKYINEIPQTLLDDFMNNRVVPMVGAGFSKNAKLPDGFKMPDWNELGKNIGKYIPDYSFTNAIDALSLFESQFSRVKLVEFLSSSLRINEIQPGDAHRSFCELFFDIICTTNFDFLIEQTLQESQRPHSIIISEDRLPINTYEKTKIIKLHGDFNHPNRMVITENDFDTFVDKNKVLTTYIANIFITQTLFLVGYSFDDLDTRSLWSIIHERLGTLARPAYTVLVDANPIEIARFERRNVKVINLKGQKSNYSKILNEFFIELKQYIELNKPKQLLATNNRILEELKLPTENKRLCLLLSSFQRIPFLKELIYPVLEANNIVPVTSNEVIAPDNSILAKNKTLIEESSIIIVDVSDRDDNLNWQLTTIRNMGKNMIIISESSRPYHDLSSIQDFKYLTYNHKGDNSNFQNKLEVAIQSLTPILYEDIYDEPLRLLEKKEYCAAIISVFRLLEISLREFYTINHETHDSIKFYSLSKMINQLIYIDKFSNFTNLISQVRDYTSTRNRIVHGSETSIHKDTAIKIVNTVLSLIKILLD